MIFLTVGTQLPFDRLVSAVDAWAGDNPDHPIFGQIADPGPDGYRPRNFEWVAHLSPGEFKSRFEGASHIVAHAGMGTIISALTQGKPILLMARRAHLGEQRNDHQQATVERFRDKPGVRVVSALEDFPTALGELQSTSKNTENSISSLANISLINAVRENFGLPILDKKIS